MTCPSCHAQNRDTAKFCVKCGSSLGLACPACGAPYEVGDVFCAECGAPLQTETQVVPREVSARAPATERRLVSVLFADLVGFTARSEDEDPEDVRDLLSRYFDVCRTISSRYGGTVEKIIGDAVMAVWGTPVAQEDDAERAVRAALELVAAVPELDERCRARAGVLTGEAAVTLDSVGQGMVAGDLVNTASRIQAEAEAGTVLVGDATRRATEAAIAYEAAGERELKGKAEALAVHRALRVTAARGGAQKVSGLEPPFVGRDREFRLVKELLHASADERRAQLVSVLGIAGIGKSRLAWELEKYIDGLTDIYWWHRGRCPAYGDGVTYWALAEMVRMRAGIVEGEAPDEARAKLSASVAEHVPDADERSWIELRLGQLLGLHERQAHEREAFEIVEWRLDDDDVQVRSAAIALRAMLRLAAGDPRAALDDARDVLAVVGALGKAHQLVKFAFTYGLEAALLAGDCGAADELLEWSASLRPGELAPSLRAQTARFRARLGDDADEVDDLFVTAIALFREYGIRFWLAVTQLEYAEWLVAHDRADEATAFVDEARARFEELGARPWLERAAALASAAPVQAA